MIHLARLSTDPGPAQVSWGVSVWPDGTRNDVAPPYSLSTRFGWPISEATVAAFGSDTSATRRSAAAWSATVSTDSAAKTLRLTARIPGLTDRAIVSPGTSHRVNATAAPTAERVSQFAVTKRTMSVDPTLAAPIATKLLDDLREVSVAGFPIPIVIPMTWQAQSLGTLKTLQGVDPAGIPSIGAFVRQPRSGETPAALLQRLVPETGGKYVVQPDDGFVLPAGFEAGILVRTSAALQMPAAPAAVLQEWDSSPGLTTRFIAGRSGESIVVAFYESDGSGASQRYADLLLRLRLPR